MCLELRNAPSKINLSKQRKVAQVCRSVALAITPGIRSDYDRLVILEAVGQSLGRAATEIKILGVIRQTWSRVKAGYGWYQDKNEVSLSTLQLVYLMYHDTNSPIQECLECGVVEGSEW